MKSAEPTTVSTRRTKRESVSEGKAKGFRRGTRAGALSADKMLFLGRAERGADEPFTLHPPKTIALCDCGVIVLYRSAWYAALRADIWTFCSISKMFFRHV
jgi:hypothetical protein